MSFEFLFIMIQRCSPRIKYPMSISHIDLLLQSLNHLSFITIFSVTDDIFKDPKSFSSFEYYVFYK